MEEALRESEERYRSLFEDSPISLWEEDFSAVKRHIDGLRASGVKDLAVYFKEHPEEVANCAAKVKVVDVNRATLELYQAESLKELRDGLGTVFSAESYDVFKEELIALSEGKMRFECDTINQTLKGDKKPISLRCSVAPSSEETLSKVLVSVIDITEQVRANERIKSSLREKEVLLQEIHHRVKNNLQIISSLLNLQSGYVQDPQAREIFQDSQHRIRSMALIHEKLYQSENLARVDFAEYIHSLATHLFRSYRANAQAITLKVQADDVSLDIDTAIPCGLILNELLSNALKHAFPDGRAGEIRVALDADREHRLTLKVSDNGVGFPSDQDFRNTASLGLQLVNTLVDQLDGTIKLDRRGGTDFEITFVVP
jgi:two-component sensor histidine kinase